MPTEHAHRSSAQWRLQHRERLSSGTYLHGHLLPDGGILEGSDSPKRSGSSVLAPLFCLSKPFRLDFSFFGSGFQQPPCSGWPVCATVSRNGSRSMSVKKRTSRATAGCFRKPRKAIDKVGSSCHRRHRSQTTVTTFSTEKETTRVFATLGATAGITTRGLFLSIVKTHENRLTHLEPQERKRRNAGCDDLLLSRKLVQPRRFGPCRQAFGSVVSTGTCDINLTKPREAHKRQRPLLGWMCVSTFRLHHINRVPGGLCTTNINGFNHLMRNYPRRWASPMDCPLLRVSPCPDRESKPGEIHHRLPSRLDINTPTVTRSKVAKQSFRKRLFTPCTSEMAQHNMERSDFGGWRPTRMCLQRNALFWSKRRCQSRRGEFR